MEKIDKNRRKTEKVYPGLWSDWPMIFTFLLLGTIGIWTSMELNRWCQITELSINKVHLGKIITKSGYSRVRKNGFISWSDIRNSVEVLPDDQIQTEEESSAYLEMFDFTEIRILANTTLIIHARKSKEKLFENRLELISSFITSPIKAEYTLELITGGIEVESIPHARELELHIGETKIFAKLGNRIMMSNKGPILSGIEYSKRNETEYKREVKTIPLTPIILSPLSGSHYLSTTTEPLEVALHWRKLPLGLAPEIELSRLDDPDFETTPLTTRNGALLQLPDGQYRWKVRTLSADNQKSEWSPVYQFSIQEYMRGIRSVIPIDTDAVPFRIE